MARLTNRRSRITSVANCSKRSRLSRSAMAAEFKREGQGKCNAQASEGRPKVSDVCNFEREEGRKRWELGDDVAAGSAFDWSFARRPPILRMRSRGTAC